MKNHLRVALVFKDFTAWLNSSCVGLNVAGQMNAKVLNANDIRTTVFPVRHNVDLVNAIESYNRNHTHPLTHVIISAPWLSVYDLKNIITFFPRINFVVQSHANVGFLQADPWGLHLLRGYLQLAKEYTNIRVAGNSSKFVYWLGDVYDSEVILLPNLYPLPANRVIKNNWDGDSELKIGAFGAARPEKNLMTAAAAALLIHKKLDVPIKLYMSAGGESKMNRVIHAIEQMYSNMPNVELIQNNWEDWNVFMQNVKEMDLLLQPSYTESFNMITADGIAVGTPTVVSDAIYWAPNSWKAAVDDADEIAEVGISLILSKCKRKAGFRALTKHNRISLKHWKEYLFN